MFDIKITGLDELQRKLDEASQAFQALDGEMATLRFNPNDPGNIDGAIREMEAAVDAKVAPYAGNALVESVAQQLKEKYRSAILEKAAAARRAYYTRSFDYRHRARTCIRLYRWFLTDICRPIPVVLISP